MVTLQFVPYTEIEDLNSVAKIEKLISLTQDEKLVLLQGKLKAEEEAELIKATMQEVDKDFKGIELAVIDPSDQELSGFDRLKEEFRRLILGDRSGFTVIGPANLVKEIKKNPNKIEVLTRD